MVKPLAAFASGDAVHSAEVAVPNIASAKEAQHGGGSVREGRPDSSRTELQVKGAFLTC